MARDLSRHNCNLDSCEKAKEGGMNIYQHMEDAGVPEEPLIYLVEAVKCIINQHEPILTIDEHSMEPVASMHVIRVLASVNYAIDESIILEIQESQQDSLIMEEKEQAKAIVEFRIMNMANSILMYCSIAGKSIKETFDSTEIIHSIPFLDHIEAIILTMIPQLLPKTELESNLMSSVKQILQHLQQQKSGMSLVCILIHAVLFLDGLVCIQAENPNDPSLPPDIAYPPQEVFSVKYVLQRKWHQDDKEKNAFIVRCLSMGRRLIVISKLPTHINTFRIALDNFDINEALLRTIKNGISKRLVSPLSCEMFGEESVFSRCPPDVLLYILEHLFSKELLSLTLVSNSFRVLASTPSLWKVLCIKELGPQLVSYKPKHHWKNEFMIRYLKMKKAASVRHRQEDYAIPQLVLPPLFIPPSIIYDPLRPFWVSWS